MIDSFFGKYRFLSNFFPCSIWLEKQCFTSVENAYQASKTLDLSLRRQFINLTPGQAKRFSKTIPARKDWNEVKLAIMEGLVRQKFSEPRFAKLLISTGNHELIEGNKWGDTYWGQCGGKGENHLGRILMRIREEVKIEQGET
jgi:ribA/ribD-fused uncharacterized protein